MGWGYARVRPGAAECRVGRPAGARRQPAGRARALRSAPAGRCRCSPARARARPRHSSSLVVDRVENGGLEPGRGPRADVQPQGRAGGAVAHRPPTGAHHAHHAGHDVPLVLLRAAPRPSRTPSDFANPIDCSARLSNDADDLRGAGRRRPRAVARSAASCAAHPWPRQRSSASLIAAARARAWTTSICSGGEPVGRADWSPRRPVLRRAHRGRGAWPTRSTTPT